MKIHVLLTLPIYSENFSVVSLFLLVNIFLLTECSYTERVYKIVRFVLKPVWMNSHTWNVCSL